MNIQAAGINSYYSHKIALEQGSDDISSSSGSGFRVQETEFEDTLPLSEDEEQADSVSLTQEDDETQEKGESSAFDGKSELTLEEKQLVEQLEEIDAEVRTHEMAHIAVGGQYITSGATFSYQRGPDGKNYAVGGEVNIDTSPVPGDPEATLQKMKQVRAAALAPGQPSSQDLKVASNAAAQVAEVMGELTELKAEEQANQMETAVSGYTREQISDAYAKTDNIYSRYPQNSFHIAA